VSAGILDNIIDWGPGRDGDSWWGEAVPYDDEVSRHRFIWVRDDEDTQPQPDICIARCRWVVDGHVMSTFDYGAWCLLVVYRRVTDPCVPFS
jgi:hypothetical protein